MTIKNENIVDRVVARLKTQPLGDLITEEDLHDIVKEAIPKTFFERRTKTEGTGYHSREVESEPAIFEIMRDLLRDSAKEAVKEWMAANAQDIAAHWKTVMDAGILHYVRELQNAQATQQVRAALEPLLRQLNDERMRLGLPTIHPSF